MSNEYIQIKAIVSDGYEHEYVVEARCAMSAVTQEIRRIRKDGGFFAQVTDDVARWYAFADLMQLEGRV